MELTVKQLIEKLEKVENKNAEVWFETDEYFLSVDRVFIDAENNILLVNAIESDHCYCDECKETETEL
nr:MAG TPA: hypothetical protein [Caudoviricetes sp.]